MNNIPNNVNGIQREKNPNVAISNYNHCPTIAGVDITTDEQGRFNLNTLHKASGEGESKAPAKWLRNAQVKELIQELIDGQNCPSPIEAKKGGASQGTFAHELLAISYAGWISPSFQLKVNQVFLDYRSGRLQPQVDPMDALRDPATMRSLLLGFSEKVLVLEDQLKVSQPKAQALDRIATADGSFCISDAAKQLQVRPKDLFAYLQSNKWIYRRLGTSWLAYQERIQQGLLEHKVTEIDKGDGSTRISTQVRLMPKGLVKLSAIFNNSTGELLQ